MLEQSKKPAFPSQEEWQKDSQRRAEISEALAPDRGRHLSFDDREKLRFEAEIAFKQERWRERVMPGGLERRLIFMHARTFLSAVDSFKKFLGVLAKMEGAPGQIADLHSDLVESFPDLRGVRNTVQHLEDRSRRIGAGTKPLDLKPVSNNFINAPDGGVLILDSLNNNRYGSTKSDGHYGEVEISVESVRKLQTILNSILQSFEWTGSPSHSPSL